MDKSCGLIGRSEELGALLRLADPSQMGQAALLSGDAGIGKTALLAAVIEHAKGAGMQVLSAAATRMEREVEFAGLHALLHARVAAVEALPARHRDPLLAILGVQGVAAPTDRLAAGVATLELLRALSASAPLVVVFDDVQWLDKSSLAAITFAARRLSGQSISVILAGRDDIAPDGLDGAVSELALRSLSDEDARRLADRQSPPSSGLVRQQVLAQSAGNPAALIELSKLVAANRHGRRWALDPLPLPKRLAATYGSALPDLEESTREALLVASAASPEDLLAAAGRLAVLNVDTLSAAELAGLITVSPAGIEFVHPLLRSAAYYLAPFTQRAAAHRELAAALIDQPDRHAWHLGRASRDPDEVVAALLESTCDQAQERGGFIAAAAALERAAELSPNSRDRARRLVAAAGSARFTGDATWAEELANRVLAITADPAQQSQARLELAWVLTWSNHHEAALSVALPLVNSTGTDTTMRWEALRAASTVAYLAGTTKARRAISAGLNDLARDNAGRSAPANLVDTQYAEATQLFTQVIADPHGDRAVIGQLREFCDEAVDPLGIAAVGVAAWVLDESDLALQLLRRAGHELRAQGLGRQSPAVLVALAWACVDAGHWDEALSTCAELVRLAAARDQPFLRALSALVTAALGAWRGDVGEARAHLTEALACIDPDDSRAAGAWAQRAAGLISLAEDSDIAAYLQLRRLFGDDGTPFHYHASYLGLADLAEAAARCGQSEGAQSLITRALAHIAGPPSPRLAQLIAHAHALLAEPDDAEQYFAAALADSAGGQWPFERARLRLGYGEWLRRHRRITDAKHELTEAMSLFESLQATPWIARAAREIRAAGVRVPSAATGLSDLSPQEHQVVYLAAQGLSNRQIGQLLHLSPRTVGAHLYRAFPKLGVSNRRQIRDIPPPAASIETANPPSADLDIEIVCCGGTDRVGETPVSAPGP